MKTIQSGKVIGLASILYSLCVVSVFTVLIAKPALAQEFRASISGEVADSTGGVIPGALVKAVNVDTGVASTAKSDTAGVYSLIYLLPGIYTVTVDAAGFQTKVYDKVRLDSAQQLGLNVALKPGNVAQQIVVTAGDVELDTVSATLGGVIDQQRVENMPSSGFEVFDDVMFVEGVKLEGPSGFILTPRNNGNGYTVSGAQTNANVFEMNGAPVSDQGSWYFVPNQGSVQQVTALSNPYDAQYGRTQGGVFSANVKNGTNAYHGSIYEHYDNDALDANTWTSDLNHNRKTLNINNVYGVESGGPIRKGKTFYFGSFEGFHQNEPLPVMKSVPPTAWIQGNFQGSGYTIYDPLSTYCAKQNSSGGCSTYARKAFTDDTIPADRINRIGQALLAMYPAPTAAGNSGNFYEAGPRIVEYQQFIGRIDQNISQKTRIYGLYAHQYNYQNASGNGFNDPASTPSIQTGYDHEVNLDLTHTFSPKLVLDVKGLYTHYTTETVSGVAIQQNYQASNLGLTMPGVPTTPHQGIVPEFTIGGMADLFGNTDSGTFDGDADFSGSITQLVGRHSLHYGFEFLDVQTSPKGVLGEPNGIFDFSGVYTRGNPLAATTGQGNAVADALLGYPDSGSVSWNEPTFVTLHYYGAFIQDDLKLLSNLSFNIGIRWDVNKSPRDRHNRINDGFCFTCENPLSGQVNYGVAPGLQGPTLGGLEFAGVNGNPSTPYAVQWTDWQPRFGFSWAALRNTVVRGGYGIFYPWATPAVDTTGFNETTSYAASLDGGLTPDNYFYSGTPYPKRGASADRSLTGARNQRRRRDQLQRHQAASPHRSALVFGRPAGIAGFSSA